MRFEEGDKIQRFNHFYPTKVVLIGTAGKRGMNVMPSSWHMAISRDPLLYGVSVSPKRYSHSLIVDSGEFTLNFLGARMSQLVKEAGDVSGRDVDKFKALGISYTAGRLVKAPVLDDAYCAYECRVSRIYPAGDHDLIIGMVVGVHTDEKAFSDNGVLNLSEVDIDLYMGSYAYATMDRNTKIRTGE